ncbi:MAG: quinone-dependent dihydroorotate dehydrogenase [Chloroflexota bacterium]|nr:MAG: quinone-dependent dihydroorotate dehydrogenase [Chloroflexota bacterium]
MYRRLLFPLLSRIDPETTHDLTLRVLELCQNHRAGRALLRSVAGQIPVRPVEVFGLQFANELGVAAGFDKDARVAPGLGHLGFGHVEVGTLTPRPQDGNQRPRVFRLPQDNALINRMGFPNLGSARAVERLKSYAGGDIRTIIGVSLGKQGTTTLENAASDYCAVMAEVYPYSDYLAVNVSSPNTPGLRELQGRTYLSQLLQTLLDDNKELAALHRISPRPLILKISPDLTWEQLDHVLEAAVDHGVSGISATNTTLSRMGLVSPHGDEPGGLSGLPLRKRSNAIIAYIWRQLGDRLPIIGAGGVFTADDAKAKLDAGAALVQLYTGLVYRGPRVAGQIVRGL